jgi:hypothetical protein
MTCGSERRLQVSSGGNLSIGAASTDTTGGEAGQASFFHPANTLDFDLNI